MGGRILREGRPVRIRSPRDAIAAGMALVLPQNEAGGSPVPVVPPPPPVVPPVVV